MPLFRRRVAWVIALLAAAAFVGAWVLRWRGEAVPLPGDWSLLPEAARQPIEEAAAACRARPGDPAAFTALGRLYHGNAAPGLAIAAYERALSLGAADARTPYLLALLYEDWGRTGDAIARLRETVDREPGYAPAWNHLGRNQLLDGETEAAIASLRRAVEIEPGGVTHHADLGRALREAGRVEEAAAALRAALAIDPDHAPSHQLLGLTLRSLGDEQGARVHLGRLRHYAAEVVHDPWLREAMSLAVSVDARLDWARSLIAAGRLDGALELLEQLAAAFPHRAEVFRRLGETHARAGRREAAAGAYTRALEIEPHDASTRTALAEIRMLQGDLEAARREIDLARDADPRDVDALVVEAAIMLKRGRASDAADRLRPVTAQRGDHVAAHFWLGEALMTLERYDEAIPVWERLVELRPDLEPARERLRLAYRKLPR